MSNDLITLLANLALTLSFIVALIFGIAQIKAAERDRKERFTLETLRNFQTREFSELIYFITSRDLPSTMEEYRKFSDKDQVMFVQFAQQMESLGILVAEGFIDMDLVDKILGSFVNTSWNKLKPVMMDIREKAPDPFLSEYFQWLAERVDERMQKNPRNPFYESKAYPNLKR